MMTARTASTPACDPPCGFDPPSRVWRVKAVEEGMSGRNCRRKLCTCLSELVQTYRHRLTHSKVSRVGELLEEAADTEDIALLGSCGCRDTVQRLDASRSDCVGGAVDCQRLDGAVADLDRCGDNRERRAHWESDDRSVFINTDSSNQ